MLYKPVWDSLLFCSSLRAINSSFAAVSSAPVSLSMAEESAGVGVAAQGAIAGVSEGTVGTGACVGSEGGGGGIRDSPEAG